VLVAADKQGKDERKFYRELLRVANRRFDDHLKKLKSEARPPKGGPVGGGSRRKQR